MISMKHLANEELRSPYTPFKIFEGCYHGFDAYVPNAKISQEAVKFTYDSYAQYYDMYVL